MRTSAVLQGLLTGLGIKERVIVIGEEETESNEQKPSSLEEESIVPVTMHVDTTTASLPNPSIVPSCDHDTMVIAQEGFDQGYAEGKKAAVALAVETMELCQIGSCESLALDMVRQALSMEQVRVVINQHRVAKQGAQVSSHVLPDQEQPKSRVFEPAASLYEKRNSYIYGG